LLAGLVDLNVNRAQGETPPHLGWFDLGRVKQESPNFGERLGGETEGRRPSASRAMVKFQATNHPRKLRTIRRQLPLCK
jgi:hypothetical protein